MEIGRKIYYEKANGVIIWDKGEMSGSVVETTFEEDKVAMPLLTLIPETELGVKQLNYGDYADEFSRVRAYRINPVTDELEFLLIPIEDIHQSPEQKIQQLEQQLLETQTKLNNIENGIIEP